MMLTPPYLQSIDWDGGGDAHCQFGDPVSSSGSMDTSTTLPATPVAMTASGYISRFRPMELGRYRDDALGLGNCAKALDGYVHE